MAGRLLDGVLMGERNVADGFTGDSLVFRSLADYGRQDLYRCATQGGKGSCMGDTVIERHTLLHLYICLLERYWAS